MGVYLSECEHFPITLVTSFEGIIFLGKSHTHKVVNQYPCWDASSISRSGFKRKLHVWQSRMEIVDYTLSI